jgi:hypothetical protein
LVRRVQCLIANELASLISLKFLDIAVDRQDLVQAGELKDAGHRRIAGGKPQLPPLAVASRWARASVEAPDESQNMVAVRLTVITSGDWAAAAIRS